MSKEQPGVEPYNYDTFRRYLFKEDVSFQGGPEPGALAPDFDLPTIDGARFRLSSFHGVKPALIEFGSIT